MCDLILSNALFVFSKFSLLLILLIYLCIDVAMYLLCCSDFSDPSNVLENSLTAKEKIISDLNMELHKIESTFSNEREQYMNDIKKLNTLLDEKVLHKIHFPCHCEGEGFFQGTLLFLELY